MKIKEIALTTCKYVAVAAIAFGIAMAVKDCKGTNSTDGVVDETEYTDSMGNYHKIYYDKDFSALKEENKQLYDSLKKQKDKIDYLVQFSYEKSYSSGIVRIEHDTVSVEKELKPTTYEYNSEPNDTFQYNLKVNSNTEPNWYSIDAHVKDKFTIVNKKSSESSVNQMTIESEGHGTVADVTAYSKKQKRSFKDRIGIGPTVTVGYDPFNKNVGVMVGVGISYNLFK